MLVASVPIIGVVLVRLTGGTERLTAARWAGLLIGLAGVAVLAGRDALGGDAWAVVEVLLVAVCYATGPIIVNRKLSELPGLGVNAFCLSFAAIVYAPAAALTWPATVPSAAEVRRRPPAKHSREKENIRACTAIGAHGECPVRGKAAIRGGPVVTAVMTTVSPY